MGEQEFISASRLLFLLISAYGFIEYDDRRDAEVRKLFLLS